MQTLVGLRGIWDESGPVRCEALARARAAFAEDPALGPLFCRLLGLDLARAGVPDDVVSAEMVRAAEIEQAAGWLLAASHTRHQLALLTSSRGRLEPMSRYYRESLETLCRQRNDRGVGLCLRSLGELQLGKGRFQVARTCWERSLRTLENEDVPEAAGPAAWLEVLATLETGPA